MQPEFNVSQFAEAYLRNLNEARPVNGFAGYGGSGGAAGLATAAPPPTCVSVSGLSLLFLCNPGAQFDEGFLDVAIEQWSFRREASYAEG